MYKSWSFYRRSTNRQEFSIDDQRTACQQAAAKRNAVIVQEFIPEKGYASGLTIEKDKVFQAMLSAAAVPNHGIKYLFVYNVSRFGRMEPRRKLVLEQLLKDRGITVVYAAENFTNDGSIGDELHQYIQHIEARQYSRNMSVITIRGARGRAQAGISCGGRPPYGYDRWLVDANHTPLCILKDGQRKSEKMQRIIFRPGDPLKQATVRRIFELYDRGNGLVSIVNLLNSEKIPSPRGGAWAKHTISSILKNEAYIGVKIYFKRCYHKDFKHAEWDMESSVRAKDQWVVKENAYEPIIDKELFERVQKRFRVHKQHDGRHQDSPYLLGGIVYCEKCRHRYYGQQKYHLGTKTPYYLCGGYHSKGSVFCESFSIPASTLEACALEEIRKRLEQPELTKEIEQNLRNYLEKLLQSNSSQKEAEGLRAAIEKNKKGAENVARAIQESYSPTLLAELKRLEDQEKAFKARLSELEGVSTAILDLDSALKEILGYLKTVPEIMANGTLQERKTVVKGFVERVDISAKDKRARFVLRRMPFLPKKIADTFLGVGESFPGISFRRDGCGGWI